MADLTPSTKKITDRVDPSKPIPPQMHPPGMTLQPALSTAFDAHLRAVDDDASKSHLFNAVNFLNR